MPENRTSDKRIRKNIMMPEAVVAIAKGMVRERYFGKNQFSHLLEDLVMDAYKRQTSGEDKNLSELLAENRALKGKMKEKDERFRLDRKSLVEALHLAEEDLKKARSSQT